MKKKYFLFVASIIVVICIFVAINCVKANNEYYDIVSISPTAVGNSFTQKVYPLGSEPNLYFHNLAVKIGKTKSQEHLYQINLPEGFFATSNGILTNDLPGIVNVYSFQLSDFVPGEKLKQEDLLCMISQWNIRASMTGEPVELACLSAKAYAVQIAVQQFAMDTLGSVYHVGNSPSNDFGQEVTKLGIEDLYYAVLFYQPNSINYYILLAQCDYVSWEDMLKLSEGISFSEKSFDKEYYNEWQANKSFNNIDDNEELFEYTKNSYLLFDLLNDENYATKSIYYAGNFFYLPPRMFAVRQNGTKLYSTLFLLCFPGGAQFGRAEIHEDVNGVKYSNNQAVKFLKDYSLKEGTAFLFEEEDFYFTEEELAVMGERGIQVADEKNRKIWYHFIIQQDQKDTVLQITVLKKCVSQETLELLLSNMY